MGLHNKQQYRNFRLRETFKFRFADDIEDMTGSRPWVGWRICWKYISPLALFLVLVATVYDLTEGTATYQAFVGCEQVFQYFLIHVLFNSPDVIVKISKQIKTRVEIKPWIKPRLKVFCCCISVNF